MEPVFVTSVRRLCDFVTGPVNTASVVCEFGTIVYKGVTYIVTSVTLLRDFVTGLCDFVTVLCEFASVHICGVRVV